MTEKDKEILAVFLHHAARNIRCPVYEQSVIQIVKAYRCTAHLTNANGQTLLHMVFLCIDFFPSVEFIHFISCPSLLLREDSKGCVPLHYACANVGISSGALNVLCELCPEAILVKTHEGNLPVDTLIQNYRSRGEVVPPQMVQLLCSRPAGCMAEEAFFMSEECVDAIFHESLFLSDECNGRWTTAKHNVGTSNSCDSSPFTNARRPLGNLTNIKLHATNSIRAKSGTYTASAEIRVRRIEATLARETALASEKEKLYGQEKQLNKQLTSQLRTVRKEYEVLEQELSWETEMRCIVEASLEQSQAEIEELEELVERNNDIVEIMQKNYAEKESTLNSVVQNRNNSMEEALRNERDAKIVAEVSLKQCRSKIDDLSLSIEKNKALVKGNANVEGSLEDKEEEQQYMRSILAEHQDIQAKEKIAKHETVFSLEHSKSKAKDLVRLVATLRRDKADVIVALKEKDQEREHLQKVIAEQKQAFSREQTLKQAAEGSLRHCRSNVKGLMKVVEQNNICIEQLKKEKSRVEVSLKKGEEEREFLRAALEKHEEDILKGKMEVHRLNYSVATLEQKLKSETAKNNHIRDMLSDDKRKEEELAKASDRLSKSLENLQKATSTKPMFAFF